MVVYDRLVYRYILHIHAYFFSIFVRYIIHLCIFSNCHKSPKSFLVYLLKNILHSSNLCDSRVNCNANAICMPYRGLASIFFHNFVITSKVLFSHKIMNVSCDEPLSVYLLCL